MNVSIMKTNGVCKVMIEGDMNIYNAAEIKDRLLNAISDSECSIIELDLFNVHEIDTSGVQLLIMLQNEAQRLNKGLSITMNNVVRNVLKLLNITIGRWDSPSGELLCR
jgi:anti-anti-sigma factor